MLRSICLVWTLLFAVRTAFAVTNCTDLKTLTLADTTITSAVTIEAGGLSEMPAAQRETLPAFCRVSAILHPTSDSVIRFEVWLPQVGWNSRIVDVGNGGFGGSIGYAQMAGNIARGYATAGSDAGHQANAEDASWAYRHPEQIVDFGWRAVHLTAKPSKDVLNAFYGQAQKTAYFDACSDGGREALMEAQRFPDDYDGILAGAPANNWAHLVSSGIPVMQATMRDPAAYISSLKLPAIMQASLAACDAQDGLKDGIVSDPAHCSFDPAVLQCKGAESVSCLTAPQVLALRAIYAGGKDSKGATIFPGLLPGDENPVWHDWILGNAPGGSNYVTGYFRYMVMNDPVWQPLTADPDTSLQLAMARTAKDVDATSPDLKRFAAHGGKLIMYHGWNDPAISPLNSIAYYNDVSKAMGMAAATGTMRLYVVPGMEHCTNGPGPNAFGQLSLPFAGGAGSGAMDALQMWVEEGKAPGMLLAAKLGGTRAAPIRIVRPLCPYPQQQKYNGTGDPTVPASFRCALP